jgi:hypothetical protein
MTSKTRSLALALMLSSTLTACGAATEQTNGVDAEDVAYGADVSINAAAPAEPGIDPAEAPADPAAAPAPETSQPIVTP